MQLWLPFSGTVGEQVVGHAGALQTKLSAHARSARAQRAVLRLGVAPARLVERLRLPCTCPPLACCTTPQRGTAVVQTPLSCMPPSTPPSPPQFIKRLSGANFTAGPGEYPQAADTRTLSIAVPPGCAVVLYEFYRFQGRSLVVTQSQSQLLEAFRNKVLSFKVSAGELANGHVDTMWGGCMFCRRAVAWRGRSHLHPAPVLP